MQEAKYLETLKWYDNELQKDPQVIGGAIFAAAWDVGQSSYNVKECEQIRAYIASGGTPPPPEPQPIPEPQPQQPIIEFAVSPLQIKAGDPVTVRYRGERIAAAWLDILPASGNTRRIALAPAVGSMVFQPTEDTLYRFTVQLPNGSYETREATVTITTEPTPQPPPSDCYIDERIRDFVSVKQGQQFKVLGVWFQNDTKAPFDKAEPNQTESRGNIDSRIILFDKQMHPLPGVWVVLDWPDGCDPRLSECDGTVKIELYSGPYALLVGDCRVEGLKLPGKRHVRYMIQIQRVV